jgi:hypothetical protein
MFQETQFWTLRHLLPAPRACGYCTHQRNEQISLESGRCTPCAYATASVARRRDGALLVASCLVVLHRAVTKRLTIGLRQRCRILPVCIRYTMGAGGRGRAGTSSRRVLLSVEPGYVRRRVDRLMRLPLSLRGELQTVEGQPVTRSSTRHAPTNVQWGGNVARLPGLAAGRGRLCSGRELPGTVSWNGCPQGEG